MELDSEESKRIWLRAKRKADLNSKGTKILTYFCKYAVDMDRALEDLKK